MDITLAPEFTTAFPDGVFGALVARGCVNRSRPLTLDVSRRAVEERLRARFASLPVEHDGVARHYVEYFRRWGQRYPVAHQAKTVLAGQPIQSPSALVEAMFIAEIDTLVLTSGHDLERLEGMLRVGVAGGDERYTKINGKEQALKAGDMTVWDARGAIACVLYGPDQRTRMGEATRAALFGAWCPVGLTRDIVAAHLDGLAALVRLEWPDALIDAPRILTARPS
jgi:DNA/RNA-binding domain of Phe-tRNA-synthetase-like protein